jgi:hypothetical protein
MWRLLNPIFFLFLFNPSLLAQPIWYFGNGAGLSFSSGTSKPIYYGKLFTLEGCATACDENGHLLFYSDGITVWNKFHKVMENGAGLNGSRSSSQSALIVPQPGVKGKYFLFTTDEKAGAKGLCYSVVDVSAKEGMVVSLKNIQLLSLSTEQIIAVRHANGKDIWVVAHQWNSTNYCVFPITMHGVGKPVVSSIGLPRSPTGVGDNREAIGYLCAASDGRKIASATCYRSDSNLELFNFDKASGKISNLNLLNVSGFPYGVCFSPDNNKLYISFLKGRSGILQYDLRDKVITEIVASEKENSYGALQVGTDGKIYLARAGNYLDVIQFPNEMGLLCRYTKNAIDLSPRSSNFGLPNPSLPTFFLQANSASITLNALDCNKVIEQPFSQKEQLVVTNVSVCESSYLLDAKNVGALFNWSTKDTANKIRVDKSGLYSVSIQKKGCTLRDSIRIRFRKENSEFRFLPSFNPESGFLNAEFYYEVEDIQGFDLKVYDQKKKKLLFETRNPKITWKGRNKKGAIVAAGEYFWLVQYKPNCPKDSKVLTKEGKVKVERIKKEILKK